MNPRGGLCFWAAAFLLVGCGGAPRATGTVPEKDREAAPPARERCADDGMVVEGLAGAVSEAEVDRVFGRHEDKLLACYAAVVEEVEEIEGGLEIALAVDEAGAVLKAHLPKSDLGSLEAEECILDLVGRFSFERSGCGVAEVSKTLSMEAPYDSAEPLAWGSGQVQETLERGSGDIARCLSGRTGIHVVVYVGKGGVALSSGAAADDFDDMAAARCLAAACRGWSFPDPGEAVAKLSLDF